MSLYQRIAWIPCIGNSKETPPLLKFLSESIRVFQWIPECKPPADLFRIQSGAMFPNLVQVRPTCGAIAPTTTSSSW
jgi:hypothetical protein